MRGSFTWPQTSGLITVLVFHLVPAVSTMSITLALCRMLGVEGTERRVRGAVAGGILVLMALVPKIGALIAIVPPFVLGGTLIFMFAMIAAVGVGMLADSMRSQRDLLLLAASLGLAMAVDFAPPALFEALAPSVRILAADGIVVGTAMAVVLNLVLPNKD